MSTYYVSYKTPSGVKERTSLTAFDLTDAKDSVKNRVRVDNNELFDCTILRIWKQQIATPRQKLGQKYGFILGCVKGAKTQFAQVGTELIVAAPMGKTIKMEQARILVEAQFAKLERDIRDVFKLAGLKVK